MNTVQFCGRLPRFNKIYAALIALARCRYFSGFPVTPRGWVDVILIGPVRSLFFVPDVGRCAEGVAHFRQPARLPTTWSQNDEHTG